MILNPGVTREDIVRVYDIGVKNIEAKAKGASRRAYGGVLRSFKGKMLEEIAGHMVSIAWKELGGNFNRISPNTNKIPILIHPDYVETCQAKYHAI